jgi:carbonic anhydrase
MNQDRSATRPERRRTAAPCRAQARRHRDQPAAPATGRNHDTDCGMLRFTDSDLEDRLRKETGRAPIAPASFYSFTDPVKNTKEQIQKARSHPWISPEVPIRGFVYDVKTGRLSEVFPDGETVTG